MLNQGSTTSKERIIFLDYLRVFAFLSVLVGHKFYGDLVHLSEKPWLHATARQVFIAILPFCPGAGVIIFFLISGYVISWSLLAQRKNSLSFLVKRFFRIYPLYFFAVGIQSVISRGGIPLKTLSLFGDFWGTPYALGGVEWTLRLEILFYLLMAIFQFFGLFQEKRKYLTPLLFLLLPLLYVLSPFPSESYLFTSYTTTYAPFLLMGIMVLLFEREEIGLSVLLVFVAAVLVQYFYNIAKYTPRQLSSHFVAYGVGLFFFCWILKDRFSKSHLVSFFSHLTYSVYLFHNWLFDVFYQFFVEQGIALWQAKLFSLVPLFVFCLLAFYLVEKPTMELGRRVAGWLERRHASQSDEKIIQT